MSTSRIPSPPPITHLLVSPLTSSVPIKDEGLDVSLEDLDKYINKSITRLKPIPQTGPNCGLAALAMIAGLTPNLCSISDIYNEAKSRKFTCNGEMFSALNMKALAEVILAPWFSVEEFSNGLNANRSFIIENLHDGALLLVPYPLWYDADKNHSPCCAQGHKAHWAVVCGVMEGTDGDVYIAARHGKSRYLGVWSLDSLDRSNANLAELDPARRDDHLEYVLPPGGVKAGLCNRFILLTRK